ncbi:putative Adenine nucleotide alpha hydrolases-like superfamily protein [Hibiscus syriacus]|uniref:Adenine nucleotide alpha hydrolases-like superfamily protein n=2 Tax=Hibiscus syriacus TaxID=106335 RepID=A0A6A3DAZ9_HIBSY|nr:putative Adenine nucleotide alpha hydrolases-like superfamily protein [Hibiscus syriacus]
MKVQQIKRSPMKRRRTLDSSPLPSSVFDQVPTDVLRSIIKKLSFIDVVQAKAVCSSWNLVGEELVSRMPWLMLPSKEEVEEGDDADARNNGYNGFLNLGENRVYNLKTTPKEFRESCCIGSSHGWLVFLEQKAIPFLFNPFRQVKIQLPPVDRLLGLKRMERKMNGEYELDYFEDYKKSCRFWFKWCGKQEVRARFIQKAILTGKPDSNNGNYGLVLLCNSGEEIAYYESAGDNSWTVIDVSHAPYQDIICHENNLFALGDKNSVEVWDLQQGRAGITKKSDIVLPIPDKLLAKEDSVKGLCSSRFYLVESCGDLLLVVRFIGDYVDRVYGTLQREWDCYNDYCTISFHVYKLDCNGRKWVEVESLGDHALFLGGNQSVSVSTDSFSNCEKNSIYFTDDNWERMEDDLLYGGHDMGIYNLKDQSFKSIYEFSSAGIQPPPCWILPPALLEP